MRRYTTQAANQVNQTLKASELYGMHLDVGETYNVAANHPDIVTSLMTRIAEKLRTFLDEIQKANADLLR